ncbi:MAG: polysaccharide pyruvyl transferase CsaB, partial [Okeania sp. SIO2H7]|nr:polysaccharide pyruvyl transferase CsaB [Okeania sp. SIO2H7]
RKRYGVETCDRFSGFRVLQILRRSDVFIWGGGSLIQDVTGIVSPIYYCGLMGLAQRLGLKTIAWAQGIGPLNRNITRFLAKSSFSNCTKVSTRDVGSASLLAEWEVPFILAPDPVWALEASPVSGLWNLPAPRVAVTLRSHPLLTASRLAILTKALIDFQKATETFILLLPFQPSIDLTIAEDIHKKMPDVSKVLILEEPGQLRGVFQGVEMAIGMRFHSLIMAAAAECRCFAISYDPKVSQLMEDLEMPGWELADLPEDPNLISTIWMDNYANGEALSPARIEFLVERSLIHQELLKTALI